MSSKGNTLCHDIAKKVSSWFATPADLALQLLVDLVKDFKMQTQATTSQTVMKAILDQFLVALLARKFDYNPERLLVSRSDIMAIHKRGR